MDAKKSLEKIAKSIDSFVTQKFRTEVLPQVLQGIGDPMLKLYLEEVIFDAVVYTRAWHLMLY